MASKQDGGGSPQPKPEAPGTFERREEPRHHTVRFTAKLIDEVGENLCLLRDISAEGMMANVYSDMHVDEQVLVEFPNGQRVRATLIWRHDDSAGFQFTKTIDIDRLLHRENDELPRRAPRIHFETLARIILEESSHLVRVQDISLGGAKLETGPVGLSGDHLRIQFDGLPIKSVCIRWVDEGHIGVKFDHPMSFDELCVWLNARRPRHHHEDGDADRSA